MLSAFLIITLAGGPSVRQSGPGKAVTFPATSVGAAPNPSFQLFPRSNAGAAECTGAIPTGTGGQAASFSRAGAQTCTKSDGTVVKLTANQPVVETLTGMALSEGNTSTTGAMLGMLDEQAMTNLTLQSEALDNAAWSILSNVVALPVITANAHTAPDGTLTAERVQVPASTGAQYSQIFNTAGYTSNNPTPCSAYVLGNGTSGTFDFNVGDGTHGVGLACAYNASKWTRCILPAIPMTGTSTGFIGMGSLAVDSGHGCLGAAADVFVWGVQCESNVNALWASSYIPTTTAAVTRSVTIWAVNNTAMTPPVTTANGCFGADAYFSKFETDTQTTFGCGFSGNGSARVPYEAAIGAGNMQIRTFDGANQSSSTGISTTATRGTLQSVEGWWVTGTGINAAGPAWGGTGTLNATYNSAIGGAVIYSLGHAQSCGSPIAAWLTRIRMDTDGSGAKCK